MVTHMGEPMGDQEIGVVSGRLLENPGELACM